MGLTIAERDKLQQLAADGHADAQDALREKGATIKARQILRNHGDEDAARRLANDRATSRASTKRHYASIRAKASQWDQAAVTHRDLHTIRNRAPDGRFRARRRTRGNTTATGNQSENESMSASVPDHTGDVMDENEDEVTGDDTRRNTVEREQSDATPHHSAEDDAPAEQTVKFEKLDDIIEISDDEEPDAPDARAFGIKEIELEMEKADLKEALLAQKAEKIDLQLRLLRMRQGGKSRR